MNILKHLTLLYIIAIDDPAGPINSNQRQRRMVTE